MKQGRLYVVGIGPGDPELLTVKGMRVLKAVSTLVVPKGREEGRSLALSIVEGIMDLHGKEIIEAFFPMRDTKKGDAALEGKWDETVKEILGVVGRGGDVAFITLGDPTLYSTFFYIYRRLVDADPDIDIEIIPGVSSINAGASRAMLALGLGDERIAVIPATQVNDLQEVFEKFDTVVLMKVHSMFGKVLGILDGMGLAGRAVYISRAGMEDERIIRNIHDVEERDMDYFSLIIVRQ
jgi:precorrin-2/cobalt-factor-2 C20-methyltransferase